MSSTKGGVVGEENDIRQGLGADAVRAGDLEPYTALRWLGTLFKGAAVFLAVAIVAEIIAGLQVEGWNALPVVLGELARTIVLAVVLWGAGDLVRLLIDLGHDVRAERILLARLTSRLRAQPAPPPARREEAAAGTDSGPGVRVRDIEHEQRERPIPEGQRLPEGGREAAD